MSDNEINDRIPEIQSIEGPKKPKEKPKTVQVRGKCGHCDNFLDTTAKEIQELDEHNHKVSFVFCPICGSNIWYLVVCQECGIKYGGN